MKSQGPCITTSTSQATGSDSGSTYELLERCLVCYRKDPPIYTNWCLRRSCLLFFDHTSNLPFKVQTIKPFYYHPLLNVFFLHTAATEEHPEDV
jgi:hypothetical protein